MTAAMCPGCASAAHAPFGRRDHRYEICKCSDCGLQFSAPMKAADSSWYEQSPLYLSRVPFLAGGARKRPARRWEFDRALSAGRGGKRLLDVGCGTGDFLYWARKAGFEATGIDFNPTSVELARRTYGADSVHVAPINGLRSRFSRATFDVVTIFEVLEHLEDPLQTVSDAMELLKPGGVLCVSVPGAMRWPAFFDPDADSPPHHLTMWTPEALKRLLERAGFPSVAVDRRPLQPKDLALHVWWRAQRLRRSLFPAGAPVRESVPETPARGRFAAARALVRPAATLVFTPLCLGMRLRPKAGGFTVYAQAQRPGTE